MIKPLVMAAGEGKRMHLRETAKVMMSVDKITPLIGNAARTLLECQYTEEKITVIVGAYKDQVQEYLGNTFNFHEQDIVGNPADGIMSWIRQERIDTLEQNQKIAVLNGDDACWNTAEAIQRLLNTCSANNCEGILLSTSYEAGQHKIGFFHNSNSVLGSCSEYRAGAGYVGGFFVVNSADFSTYLETSQSDNRTIVTYLRDRQAAGGAIAVQIDTEPRVCINTRDALFQARHLYDRRAA